MGATINSSICNNFRNVPCAPNLISTFILLSLGRSTCWWINSTRGYHSPSSQCFGTGMVYYIYFLIIEIDSS